MKIVAFRPVVFLAFAVCLLTTAASAQTRVSGAGGIGQQNQQGVFGTQSPFGNQGQSSIGQGGQQRGGQFGGFGANQNQQGTRRQDGFVGSDANQIRDQRRNQRQRRGALFDLAVESLNEMRDARRERNARRNAPAPVRVRLRPLFSAKLANPADTTTNVQSRLDRALPTSAVGTKVTVEGSRATLDGTAASEYESKLAAKMVSLTPGIYEVDNRLTIEPSTNPQPR
ncbi:MAG: BON domain-containing protein [Planctomycetota bacterium]